MDSRRAGGAVLVVGLALLSSPLYWGQLQQLGVAASLDPPGAVGSAPFGAYPMAVGSVAMAVGGAVVAFAGTEYRPSTIVFGGGLAGAVAAVLVVFAIAGTPPLLAVQVGLAGAAPGFGAVRGAAETSARRRLGTSLVLLSLVPYVGAEIVRGVTTAGLAGFASFLLAVALLAYTAALSYPFDRLGRVVR